MIFTESERDNLEWGDLCNANKLLAGRIEINQPIEEIELKPPEETGGDMRTERFQRSVGVLEPKVAKVRCDASYDCSLQRSSIDVITRYVGVEGVLRCLSLRHD